MVVEQEFADLYPLSEEHLLTYLSDTDCGDCGYSSCVGLAEALLAGKAEASQCSQLEPRIATVMDAILRFEAPVLPYNLMMEAFPPGLVRLGSPKSSAPVLVTCNFQGTVRLLEQIADVTEMKAFLLMSDTKGYSVDNAVMEKRFNAFEILKVLNQTEIGSFVDHRTLLIPGLARHLTSQIKQVTGWEVVTGPVSGFELPLFVLTEGLST